MYIFSGIALTGTCVRVIVGLWTGTEKRKAVRLSHSLTASAAPFLPSTRERWQAEYNMAKLYCQEERFVTMSAEEKRALLLKMLDNASDQQILLFCELLRNENWVNPNKESLAL